ncbi:hypothetical protein [Micromonospora sp. DT31]|uniref:hypothetical protein n=1 Tax=Micromonospora sp. DT31 TaxID=3393434 RepID=UPI003CE6CEB7
MAPDRLRGAPPRTTDRPAGTGAHGPEAGTAAPVPGEPRWDKPTIQVQQIAPLLREEMERAAAAQQEARPTGTTGEAGRADGSPRTSPEGAPSVSAPPAGGPPVSGPPMYAPPASAPPSTAGPVSAPPVSAPPGRPTSAPPAYPTSAPPAYPTSAPPGHPTSGPPGYPVSAPPGHPAGAPPAYPTSAAPAGGYPPPVSAPPAAPVSATPVSGASVPPWGMVAPPWSSMAPSQPVDRPGEPEPTPAEPDAVDADGEPAEEAPDGKRPLPVYDGLLEFPELAKPKSTSPEPGPGAWPVAPPAFHQPTAYPEAEAEEPERTGRNRTVLVLVVAGVLLVAAVVGGAVWLGRSAAAPPGPTPSPSASKVAGPPPGDLRLRDETTTVTVTWTDPTNGGVPFMVAGGRAGQKLGVMATVDAGQTRYTVNGLSAKLDYCFTVLAVYSTETYATSGQVCTDREGGPTAN